MTAKTVAMIGSKMCASNGSPTAPIASEVSVTPSCIAEMNRGGSLVIRSTDRARPTPWWLSSMIRVRRAVTRPYSAATKNAFSTSRPRRASSSSARIMRSRPLRARAYWAAARRPSGSTADRSSRGRRRNLARTAAGAHARGERMFYDGRRGGDRVPRGALQGGAQPRQGHAVRLVAEPVHGLCPSLHVLLRPRVRAPRRPPLRRALRPVDPRQGERRRGAAGRARAAVMGARGGRDRRGHRPLPAGRGPLPPDPRVPRGAGRGGDAVLDHHARADDRPRPRRPHRGGAPGEGCGDLLDSDRRPRRVEAYGAVDGAADPAAAGAVEARRRRHPYLRRDGARPARDLRCAGAARRRRAGRPGGRCVRNLVERALPAAGDARALPRVAGPRVARARA